MAWVRRRVRVALAPVISALRARTRATWARQRSTARRLVIAAANAANRPFTELTPEAANELGGLVRSLASALEAVTGCVKTYLMQFSEKEGFSHLHVHLVPRQPDQPVEARGPGVFAYMTDNEEQWLPADTQDAIATSIREQLASTAAG